ncbi:DUF4325 domain-containing protein [Pseudomonas mosselii]|nr:DUF4325 domain-containing protein [Pseudomonas mosselii]
MEDGIYSGEAFRENILIPNLEQYEIITLSLDGGCGYGSSFLEEAFGGLVRHGHTATDLEGRLNLISAKNPHLIREIWKYIRSN